MSAQRSHNGLLLLVAFALASAAVLPAGAQATTRRRPVHVRIVSRLELDLRGTDAPRAHAKLAVTLPANQPLVGDLLSDPHGARYRRAARWFLDGLGVFGDGTSNIRAFGVPDLDAKPWTIRPTIRHGRAHIWVGWHHQLTLGGTALGLWSLEVGHGHVRIDATRVPLRPRRRTIAVTLIQEVQGRGAHLVAIDPAPGRSADGVGGRWVGFVAAHVELHERLPTRWLQIATGGRRSVAGPAHLLAFLLTALWPLVALTWFAYRADLGPPAARRDALRLCALATLGGAGVLGVDTWIWRGSAPLGLLPLLRIATVTILVALIAGWAYDGRRRVIGGIAAAAVGLAALLDYGFVEPHSWTPARTTLLHGGVALGVALALTIAVAVLAVTATIDWLAPTARRRWRLGAAALAVAFCGVALIPATEAANDIVDQHALTLTAWGIDRTAYVATSMYYLLGGLVFRLVDVLPLLALPLAARLLRPPAGTPPELVPGDAARRIIVLLFAAFVGGYGVVMSYTMPFAMIAAGAVMAFALYLGHTAADELRALVTPRLPRRRAWLTGDIGVKPRPPLTAAAMLSAGPGGDWWANGRAAVRYGAVVALIPAAHYVIASYAQADPFSWGNADGALDFAEIVAREYAFWLVGAFAFGALFFALLPGRPGFLKGLVPAAAFALSQGVIELFPGPFDSVSWPVLSVETALFFTILGGMLDWATLREHGLPLTTIETIAGLDRTRLLVTYLSPVALAAFFVLQQVITGEAQHTVSSIFDLASGQTPPSPAAHP